MSLTGVPRRLDDLPLLGLGMALGAGLMFPRAFQSFQGMTLILLQVIFFVSGLRIDFQSIVSELRDIKLLLTVGLLRLVIFPVLTAVLATLFFPSLLAPLVLLSAMPAGMTSPLFVDMIRGNVPLSLFVTAGTSLFSVLTIPVVLSFLVERSEIFDPWMIFRTLFLALVIPLILAQMVRLLPLGKRLIQRGQSVSRAGSLFALWLLIATIAAKQSGAILSGLASANSVKAFFILSVLFGLFHVACYFVCFWRSRRDRITVTLSLSYMNFTLAIFLAESLFHDPAGILVVILSMLPWNIGLIVFQWGVRRSNWMLPEEDAPDKKKPAFAS